MSEGFRKLTEVEVLACVETCPNADRDTVFDYLLNVLPSIREEQFRSITIKEAAYRAMLKRLDELPVFKDTRQAMLNGLRMAHHDILRDKR